MANSAADVLIDVLHHWGAEVMFGLPGDGINGAHAAASLHAHVCCALAPVRHVEYLFGHVRIEAMMFEGALTPRAGALEPERSRAGFGLEVKRSEAARYAA